ncbi:MAG: carbohydrate porin [Phycisphaeraceae bacterium]|nr:MAG: carbohydrate porin [Phycisphaeraceae bacterium]
MGLGRTHTRAGSAVVLFLSGLPAALAPAEPPGVALAGAEERFNEGEVSLAPPELTQRPEAAARRIDDATDTPSGEEPETPRSWFGHRPWWAWDRATGDWGGARAALETRGISIEGFHLFEWSGVWDGGLSRRASSRMLTDINVTLSFDPLLGWKGATAFMDAYWYGGRDPSEDVGDYQGVSNIASDRSLDQIGELWFQQMLLDDTLRLKFGKIEANAEFGFLVSASDFVNTSVALSPTVFALPSYPDPAMGFIIEVAPSQHIAIRAALFDGASAADGVRTGANGPASFFSDRQSDDLFLIFELDLRGTPIAGLPGRAAAGIWRHTGDFETLDETGTSGAQGAYLMLEQRLSGDGADDEGRGWRAFIRAGWADDDVSEVQWHVAAGASHVGSFAGRDDDAFGIQATWVDLVQRAGYDDDETAIECFYKAQLTPFLSVKPGLQFIVNPGGDSQINDAVVGLLRVQVDF